MRIRVSDRVRVRVMASESGYRVRIWDKVRVVLRIAMRVSTRVRG